jgi:2-polyprenyl-6-methoxyphenol hydroxylase-like FAD-dependent oxidoreductase
MEKNGNPQVVIVGAGIGGSALATVLARAGVAVTMLEKVLPAEMFDESILDRLRAM